MQGTVPSGSESLTLIEQAMSATAVEIDAQLIAFVLPSTPESARMARFHVRAALGQCRSAGSGDRSAAQRAFL
jgi:hypothetical protein